MANRRSGRITSSGSTGPTAKRVKRWKTSTAAATPIPRRRNGRGCQLEPAAAAPHLAAAAPEVIVEDRINAAAVPVARDEPDPFARGPTHAGWRLRREPPAVDDEIAAERRLHHLDHVPL